MFCVNIVHSQNVTGWAIILHIFYAIDGLKLCTKIQKLHFHNTQRYCGSAAFGLD